MATQTLYNSCGPYLVNTDWTQDFKDAMAAMGAARGTVLTFDEKQAFWLLYQDTGGTAGQYVDFRNVLIRVGNPPTLSTGASDSYDIYSVNNGFNFTIPELIGYKVGDVKIGGQPQDPITEQYYYNVATGYFDFTTEIQNQNITLHATKLVESPDPDPDKMQQFSSSDFASSDFA